MQINLREIAQLLKQESFKAEQQENRNLKGFLKRLGIKIPTFTPEFSVQFDVPLLEGKNLPTLDKSILRIDFQIKQLIEKKKSFAKNSEDREYAEIAIAYLENRKEILSKFNSLHEGNLRNAVEIMNEDKRVWGTKFEIFKKIEELQKEVNEIENQIISTFFQKERDKQKFGIDKRLERLEIKFKAKKEELEKLESENETEARAVRLLRYKRELSEPGHISVTESVEKDIASVLTSIEMGKFFILHGPTGTGKTSIAVKASFMATGQDPFVIACGPQLRESNLWGKTGLVAEERQIDATGKMDMATFTQFIHGPLTEAIKEGRGIIFDEFNLLESAQQNMIKAIANKQEGDYIDIPGDGRIKKHPNFHIGAAVNLAGEKHKREEMSSETLREFRPEKIDYSEGAEAYDVFLARSLNELDQINLSHFDLTSTIPELMKVFVEIQKAYKGKLDMAGLQQLGISQATSMNAKSLGQLNTFVLGHWNLKTILQRYFGARNSIDKKSLIEIIDEELLKLLEINEKDKNLAARILLRSGFLNTLSDKQKEDLGIANPGIPFETETQINTKIEKSKNTKVWNIREIAELDPFNLRTRKTDEDLVSLDAEIKGEIPKNNLNTTEQIINNKKTLAQIQAENATWRAGVSWAKDYSPTAPIHRIDINSINYSDSTLLTVDQSKAGEITHIDQETPANLDHFFENTKPETIDPNTNPAFADLFKDANGNKRIPKRHEVFQRVISLYKDKYYIPGIDYMNWLMQNPGHSNAQALKNSRWNFFPSSVFRSDNGNSFVPCLFWGSSKWNPDGS